VEVTYNLIACDRDQHYLLPPSINDWLGEGHLARFLVDVVDELDLGAFYARRREDGWGRAAFDPKVMVSLLLYCYSHGERSSRKIERRCKEDVACRFITANHAPDHSTIARFRQSHEQELNGLFTEALRLCARAGLVTVGLVALDSTKVEANASSWVIRTEDQIDKEVQRILDEAAQIDAEEDRRFGKDRRGDQLPDDLVDRNSRLARLKHAKAALQEDLAERQRAYEERMQERSAEESRRGTKLRGRKPQPPDPSDLKDTRVNITDPDSRVMKTPSGYIQGYNAQAIANENQIVLAATVTSEHNDYDQLHPMMDAMHQNLQAAGVEQKVGTLVADSGYLSDDNLLAAADDTPELLIAVVNDRDQRVDKKAPRGRIPKDLSPTKRMARKLATKRGQNLYRKRGQMVEPVFAHRKTRGCGRFMRRGRTACDSEWKFEHTTHNLLKLWRSRRSGGLNQPTRSRRTIRQSRRMTVPQRLLRWMSCGDVC
jgi:transposase